MVKQSDPEAKTALPLSRTRILQTALNLADEGGIEALSMRKVAQQLDVQAMSLYNHVKNKDDMIDGIVDVVIGEITLPELQTDWQTAMQQRAISAHQVLLTHSWATMAIASRVNIGEANLRYVDATIGCLVNAGFSYPTADHVWQAIDSYIYGFTLHTLNFPFQQDEYAQVAKEYLSLIPAQKYPYLNNLTHHIIDGRHNGIHDFNFGLEILLLGFDRLREIPPLRP